MAIQDKFTTSNRIYKIISTIDLEGETLTIPNNSTLYFRGGKINNGTVKFQNTALQNIISLSDIGTATIDSTSTYRKGQMLYDVDKNKPIWYDGSKWVYADGTSINDDV